jgi:hypothetical protein
VKIRISQDVLPVLFQVLPISPTLVHTLHYTMVAKHHVILPPQTATTVVTTSNAKGVVIQTFLALINSLYIQSYEALKKSTVLNCVDSILMTFLLSGYCSKLQRNLNPNSKF